MSEPINAPTSTEGKAKATCPHFDECNAPMCPLDPRLDKRTWYPDEALCRSVKRRRGLVWYAQQAKIARKVGHLGREAGFFYVSMLQVPCVVGRGMRGLNPDHYLDSESARLAKWHRDHPPIVVSDEEREARRQRALDRGFGAHPG